MFRPHAQLLIVLCALFLFVHFAPVTSTSQATHHSLSLNVTSSYVSVPNSTSLSISGPITIEAWIKVNSINGNYQDIVTSQKLNFMPYRLTSCRQHRILIDATPTRDTNWN